MMKKIIAIVLIAILVCFITCVSLRKSSDPKESIVSGNVINVLITNNSLDSINQNIVLYKKKDILLFMSFIKNAKEVYDARVNINRGFAEISINKSNNKVNDFSIIDTEYDGLIIRYETSSWKPHYYRNDDLLSFLKRTSDSSLVK